MQEATQLEAIESSVRLADEAYRRLREAIIAGLLPAGSRLSIPEIARRLAISRSPAREAVLRLADDGLADITPHKGAAVVRLAPDDLHGLYDLREVLEGLASRLAAETAIDADVERMNRIMDAHRSAVANSDLEAHRRTDLSFHAAVREASRNRRLIDILEQYQSQIQIGLLKTSTAPERARLALRDHERIFDAIRKRDPQRAEAETRRHIVRLRGLLAADLTLLSDGEPTSRRPG